MRSKVLLLLAGMVIGATVVVPASAHVTDSVEHLWKHFQKRITWQSVRNVPQEIADGNDAVGVAGYQTVTATTAAPQDDNYHGLPEAIEEPCPIGKVAIGGGWEVKEGRMDILASIPSADGTAWRVVFQRTGPGPLNIRLHVVCASAAL